MAIAAEGVPQAEREARLVSVLSRARRGGIAPERILAILGSALAVAGLILIVVGWVGTSHTVLVAGQIPYVVTGGLLGLGLLFLGGFLYFGYWLALLLRDGRAQAAADREDTARLAAALEEVNHNLAALTAQLAADREPVRRRSVRP
jgi:hypothetical protein